MPDRITVVLELRHNESCAIISAYQRPGSMIRPDRENGVDDVQSIITAALDVWRTQIRSQNVCENFSTDSLVVAPSVAPAAESSQLRAQLICANWECPASNHQTATPNCLSPRLSTARLVRDRAASPSARVSCSRPKPRYRCLQWLRLLQSAPPQTMARTKPTVPRLRGTAGDSDQGLRLAGRSWICLFLSFKCFTSTMTCCPAGESVSKSGPRVPGRPGSLRMR